MHEKTLKKVAWIQAVAAFIGFLDATFLTVEHYAGLSLPCITGAACDLVTKSVYSTIGPVPISLLGALYYLTFLLLAVYVIQTGSERIARMAYLLSWSGFLISILLVSLQLFVLYAICIYCMGSAASSTLLWLTSMYGLRQLKREKEGIQIT
ncbi:MAG: vitamin K epoxide reductase family protein [Patescibacteria group bacterium]